MRFDGNHLKGLGIYQSHLLDSYVSHSQIKNLSKSGTSARKTGNPITPSEMFRIRMNT